MNIEIERLTNHMELSHFADADTRSANKKIPRILRNLKVHYHLHTNLPLVPIQTISNPISLRFILILSPHLCLGFSHHQPASGLPNKIL